MRQIHETAFKTGDINLAAALLACGCNLYRHEPCKIIASDNGETYASFRIIDSGDPMFEVNMLNSYWAAKKAPERHAFGELMEFINDRPLQKMTNEDWLDYARDYAKQRNPKAILPNSIKDIPLVSPDGGETAEAYAFAFVHCRNGCLDLMRNAKRAIMINKGNGAATVDVSMSKKDRAEFFGRL